MARELRTLAVVLALGGCRRAEENVVQDVDATVSTARPTVITVTWRTTLPVAGWVAFEVDGQQRQTPPEPEPTTSHQAVVVGVPPETPITLRATGEDGAQSEPVEVQTGRLPEGLPAWTISGPTDDRWRSLPVLSSETDDVQIVVIDPKGRIVWSHTDTRGAGVFRSRVLRDGSGVVYTSTLLRGQPSEASALIKVRWDGAEEVLELPWMAHDFVELPDGTLASLTYEDQDGVQGNAVVELAPDGALSAVWSTFDCFDPVEHPGDDPAHGWTHANALDYDPERGLYLVGMRNLGTIVEVDRATGACGAAFGGTGGNIALEGATFYHQHQFERIPGGLLVFDNDGAPGAESRVLEYSYEDGAETATLLRSFRGDEPLFSFILGDVYRSEAGETSITWSVEGLLDRYAPDGTRVMRLQADRGWVLGFTHTFGDLYRPEE